MYYIRKKLSYSDLRKVYDYYLNNININLVSNTFQTINSPIKISEYLCHRLFET